MTSDVKETSETSITTPTDLTIRIDRIFDAPPELVWELWTDPDLMAEWLGPKAMTITFDEMDVRVGGAYSYSATGPDGSVVTFSGKYREVAPPRVLESTFNFSGIDCAESIDRLELEAVEGGRTLMICVSTFVSIEERDGKLRSGMSTGVTEGFEKADTLIARLRGEREQA